jgi:hydrogenase expression/formation protein HypD
MVYSPVDAVQLARQNPSREVVFLAVGFETTAPATALAILQARQLGLTNFSVLAHHVRVEPAMKAILQQPDCRVQGFLAAGHVCTVSGYSHYEGLVQSYHVPVVVTGFEPLDLMTGLLECVRLLEQGKPELSNQYARAARPAGNAGARALLEEVFEVDTIPWRGFGKIPDGGLAIRPKYRCFDAMSRFPINGGSMSTDSECLSADVLSGRIKPPQCPLFGAKCHPDHPLGAPMVSSEGACAAYFRYSKPVEVAP